MSIILGIETSCDETAAAIFDSSKNKILSSRLFSQIKLHHLYGGVVPEIASRSHLEKIDIVLNEAFEESKLNISNIDAVAVTTGPGLIGSLLVGTSFAKAIAWGLDKKLIAVDHLEGHIFSSFLNKNFTTSSKISFPHLALSVSGGHTALYYVENFGKFSIIAQTLDDAAGEAFDKTAKLLDLGYPGGPIIEQYAQKIEIKNHINLPSCKTLSKKMALSFSGLKTAILYYLVKQKLYDLKRGPIQKISDDIKAKIASSLLFVVGEIFNQIIKEAINKYPQINGVTFVGGVACNNYLKNKLQNLCLKNKLWFIAPPCNFCSDNAAMIAFVGSYKLKRGQNSNIFLDVSK